MNNNITPYRSADLVLAPLPQKPRWYRTRLLFLWTFGWWWSGDLELRTTTEGVTIKISAISARSIKLTWNEAALFLVWLNTQPRVGTLLLEHGGELMEIESWYARKMRLRLRVLVDRHKERWTAPRTIRCNATGKYSEMLGAGCHRSGYTYFANDTDEKFVVTVDPRTKKHSWKRLLPGDELLGDELNTGDPSIDP